MTVFWLLFVALALAAAQAVIFQHLNLKRLKYERRFSARSAYEGDRVQLIEVLGNAKPLPVPWLRVESRISPHLRFGREGSIDAAQEVSANQYHKSVFFLAPFSQITRRHEVTCLKRGHYDAGSIALTSGDLLGVSNNNMQIQLDCQLDVYPRLLSESELDSSSIRWQGDLAVKRWIMPDPFLTGGIRDYRAGDPMRDVHWRASARMGQLQVKVRDFTADPRVLVVLNVENSTEQWGDLMDYEQEGIEQGFRIAATLCMRALSVGVEAGFASNACLYSERGSGRGILVPPARHAEQSGVILSAMAQATLHREVNFSAFLSRLSQYTGVDMLVLSTFESEAIRRQIDALRLAGCSVTFYPLERGKRRAEAV